MSWAVWEMGKSTGSHQRCELGRVPATLSLSFSSVKWDSGWAGLGWAGLGWAGAPRGSAWKAHSSEPTSGEQNLSCSLLPFLCPHFNIYSAYFLFIPLWRERDHSKRLSRGGAGSSPLHCEERLPSVFFFSRAPGSREVV